MAQKKVLIVTGEMTQQIVFKNSINSILPLDETYVAANLDDAESYLHNNDDVELVLLEWEFPPKCGSPASEKLGGRLLKFIANLNRSIKTIVCSVSLYDSDLRDFPEAKLVISVPYNSLPDRLRAAL